MIALDETTARLVREQLTADCSKMKDLLVGLWDSKGKVAEEIHAIRKLVPHEHAKLERYEVKAVTGGTDAQAEVSVLLSEDGRTTRGRGARSAPY